MIFTYWTGDPAGILPFERAWKAVDADVQVYNDTHVTSILYRMDPVYVALYGRIRIAACKSDIARLALLYAHGGLYMDAHGAPNNITALEILIEDMKLWEVIVFDEVLNRKDPDDTHILTGALAAHRGSAVIATLLTGVMNNLCNHATREAASAIRVDYNIFVLSGPWEIRAKLLTLTRPFVVKPELQDRVLRKILERDLSERAFLWYVNYGYRRPGQHWSERQKIDPLFDA